MNSTIEWLEKECTEILQTIQKLYDKKKDENEISFLEGQHFACNTVLQKLKSDGFCCLRSDDSGRWYLIPFSKAKLFYPMLDKTNRGLPTDEKYQEEFIDAFELYRLSGGVEDLEILV